MILYTYPFTVIGAETDPWPGWVNSWQGLNSILVKQGKGLLRCWNTDRHLVLDLIPVDYVANLMIAAAWDINKRR